MSPSRTSDEPAAPPVSRRPRFTIRGMMLATLVVAIGMGIWAAVANRWERSVQAWVNLHAQSNATFDAVKRTPIPFKTGTGWSCSSIMTPPSLWYANDQVWTIDIDSHAGQPWARVTGSARHGRTTTDPIIIEDRGGELSDRVIATLVAAYRTRGWRYRVVPKPAARLDSQLR